MKKIEIIDERVILIFVSLDQHSLVENKEPVM